MEHTDRIAMLRRGPRISLLAPSRRHFYKGYGASNVQEIVHNVMVPGAKNLIITNAAGGLNPQFRAGDVMLIDDYIGMMLGACMAMQKNDYT